MMDSDGSKISQTGAPFLETFLAKNSNEWIKKNIFRIMKL